MDALIYYKKFFMTVEVPCQYSITESSETKKREGNRIVPPSYYDQFGLPLLFIFHVIFYA